MFGRGRFDDGFGIFEITIDRLDGFGDSVLLDNVSDFDLGH